MQKILFEHTPEEMEVFRTYRAPAKPVKFCSVDLRDGQQSLYSTRWTTDDIVHLAAMMDKVGFDSMEVWGGATFDCAMRFLGEDPFERLRRLKAACPNTPLRMLFRGQNVLGYTQYPDDIVEKFVEKSAENGIDIFLIFDGLMDPRNCEAACRAAVKSGKRVEMNLLYTTSPAHNDKLYVDIARKYVELGATAIHLEDMAGMKDPISVFTTIRALKEALDVPIHYQAHATAGMADISYWEAVRAGADVIDCDFSCLSLGTAHPPLESLAVALQMTEWDAGLDLDLLAEINAEMKKICAKYEEFHSAFSGVDVSCLKHQVPGGMLSNLESQLKALGALDRLDEVLVENSRVHKEFGYPPLGTPFSQIVGTQAAMNVINGERYKVIPKESKTYMRGMYGAFPAPVDPEIQKLCIGDEEVITCRPADLLEPGFEKAKAEIGDLAHNDEEVLMYCLFPQVARDFLEKKRAQEEARTKFSIERIED